MIKVVWISLLLNISYVFAADNFLLGVKAFEEKKLDESRQYFIQVITENPKNAEANFNIGKIEFEQKKYGLALAYFRKAYFLSPQIENIKQQMLEVKKLLKSSAFVGKTTFWEEYRNQIIATISIHQIVFLLFIFTTCSGFFSFRLFKNYKIKKENSAFFKSTSMIFFILTFFMFTVYVSKVVDIYSPRGTIIEQNVRAYTSPGNTASEISEYFEGQEVIVLKDHKENNSQWYQVKSPGGIAGWIEAKQFLFTSGLYL